VTVVWMAESFFVCACSDVEKQQKQCQSNVWMHFPILTKGESGSKRLTGSVCRLYFYVFFAGRSQSGRSHESVLLTHRQALNKVNFLLICPPKIANLVSEDVWLV